MNIEWTRRIHVHCCHFLNGDQLFHYFIWRNKQHIDFALIIKFSGLLSAKFNVLEQCTKEGFVSFLFLKENRIGSINRFLKRIQYSRTKQTNGWYD